jgi:hypothetical protein
MQTYPAQWVGLKALERGLGVGGRKRKKSKRKQKRKPLALAQKMHEDSTLGIHEILAIKVELTLAK